MIIKENKILGVYEVSPEPNMDERGFFMRTYDRKIFGEYGIDRKWMQENHSRSEKKGIIRGLHFQLPPFTETKLVRAIKGAILDVFVDLRKNSPTFGQWDSIELSEKNKKMILIPRGFAHGFCTLTTISEIVYKVDNYHNPKFESGIIWNDKDLNINWLTPDPFLSARDSKLGTFGNFLEKYNSLEES